MYNCERTGIDDLFSDSFRTCQRYNGTKVCFRQCGVTKFVGLNEHGQLFGYQKL